MYYDQELPADCTEGFKKNTLFSAINIIGLSTGLAASIIIYLWVSDELGFDAFHENSDRIYRLERDMRVEDERIHVPITAPPTGPKMQEQYPQVEAFVRIGRDNVMVEDKNRQFYSERIVYADNTFFDVFSFRLMEGDKDACLKEPFTIAISESYTRKYFGGRPTGSWNIPGTATGWYTTQEALCCLMQGSTCCLDHLPGSS